MFLPCAERFRLSRHWHALLLILILALALLPKSAQAEPMRFPRPLAALSEEATAVVVAQIIAEPGIADVGQKPFEAGQAGPQSTELRGRVITALEGDLSGEFTAKVPQPDIAFLNVGIYLVRAGDTALIFLKRSGDGWEVVDGFVPAIKLDADRSRLLRLLDESRAEKQILPRVVPLLLSCLPDAQLRRAAAFYLSAVEDTRLVQALRPYANDPDLKTRDWVLGGLLTNQYIDAIPLMAKLARTKWKANRTTPFNLYRIGSIRNPKAVALLNPLLFEESPYTRIQVMAALRPVADKSSIPFLMRALRDPEAQRLVAYSAYYLLHRFANLPGNPRDTDYFAKHQEEVTQPIYRWYAKLQAAGAITAKDVRTKVLGQPGHRSWQAINIGAGTQGKVTYGKDTLTVTSNGQDVFFAGDAFTFVYQPVQATHFSVTATVNSVTAAGPAASAGLMIRESTAANARHVNLRVTPKGDAVLAYRDVSHPGSTFTSAGHYNFPITLRLQNDNCDVVASVRQSSIWIEVGRVHLSPLTIAAVGAAVFSNKQEQFTKAEISACTVLPATPVRGKNLQHHATSSASSDIASYGGPYARQSDIKRTVVVQGAPVRYTTIDAWEDAADLIVVASPTQDFVDRRHWVSYFQDGHIASFGTEGKFRVTKVIKKDRDQNGAVPLLISVHEPVGIVGQSELGLTKLRVNDYIEMKQGASYLLFLRTVQSDSSRSNVSATAAASYSVMGLNVGKYNTDGTDKEDDTAHDEPETKPKQNPIGPPFVSQKIRFKALIPARYFWLLK